MAGIRCFASMGRLLALTARAWLCSPAPASRPPVQTPPAHLKHLNLYPNYLGKPIKMKTFSVCACGQKYILSPGQDGSPRLQHQLTYSCVRCGDHSDPLSPYRRTIWAQQSVTGSGPQGLWSWQKFQTQGNPPHSRCSLEAVHHYPRYRKLH